MAKKRASTKKKRSKPQRIQMRFTAIEKPAGVTPAEYWQTLLEAVDTGELPDGWEVGLGWRNPDVKKGKSKNWQYGEFSSVLADSNTGFGIVAKELLGRAVAAKHQSQNRKVVRRANQNPKVVTRKRAAKQGRLF